MAQLSGAARQERKRIRLSALAFLSIIPPLLLTGCVSGQGGLLGVADIGSEPAAEQQAAKAAVAADAPQDGKSTRVAAKSALPRNGTISGSPELDRMIAKAADENDVPRELAYAVLRVESHYNPKAVGRGVYGLSQIKPATARSLGFSGSAQDLLDPETNLRYGMKYLAGAYEKGGGDVCATSMKYKGGHRATVMSQSTREYCSSIKRHMAAISNRPMGNTEMARLQPSTKPDAGAAQKLNRPAAPATAKATAPAQAPAAHETTEVASLTAPARPAAKPAAAAKRQTPSAVAAAMTEGTARHTPATDAVANAIAVPVPGHAERPVTVAAQAQPAKAAQSAPPQKVAVPSHALAAAAKPAPQQVFASVPVPQASAALGFSDEEPDPARFGQ
ncbi:lytic transglycosylase domain-containing protein [Aureimonas frigidaquae]|uniref:lytic transglycosylase domain-containing protein n=1 Tax=Aureimonas frigidaquae TaxID=424757 RepID=UPI000781B840|nr:transglycosylase SLT domain-containing protein [Aureimonas frigidaquae]